MLKGIDAVIFDLDGTLIDSTWVWPKIDKDYLDNMGVIPSKDYVKDIRHLSMTQVAVYFKENFSIPDSLEEIQNTWNHMAYMKYTSDVPLIKGADKFLAHLKGLGIKIGIATTNSKVLLEAVLKAHNIYQYFDTITIADEVNKGKDSPEIYLLTAKKLEASPDRCLVFEDIETAIKSARSAGMRVVAVQDPFKADEWDKIQRLADYHIVDYEGLLKLN